MAFSITAITIGAIGTLILWSLITRARNWYRLRHIPGPPAAGWTKAFLVYHQFSGKLLQHLRNVAQKHGTPSPPPPTHTKPLEPNKIESHPPWLDTGRSCTGRGRCGNWSKGYSFTSETEGAELMVNVQDARVFVRWPRRDKDQDALGHLSDSTWDESSRLRVARAGSELHGSPLRRTTRLTSPESPTPADDDAPVEIYEDASADEKSAPSCPRSKAAACCKLPLTNVTESFFSDFQRPAV
ncbi:hypothetical protein CHGG_04038 [Chaetomium globosum CBS 148.51]|uniref:Uncharacterized protein n=1 Tax=Chaetomium globosum (strain ATCC 6205 / CBS 148.51 / DSM 1962 / NBRC 6347 / NRRL 1970) TaxID=306901 RepID=Q2H2F8_CHAGB|nr:uncharacterized protein CHGG_04038 [Chaetomium globosum CBS 148.51]EAQ87419.1 hypothetical protein CHGG_04038 [Chaetomium globosum CBS 148.51]